MQSGRDPITKKVHVNARCKQDMSSSSDVLCMLLQKKEHFYVFEPQLSKSKPLKYNDSFPKH